MFENNDFYVYLSLRFNTRLVKEKLLKNFSLESFNNRFNESKLYYYEKDDYFVETFQKEKEIMFRKYNLDFKGLNIALEVLYERNQKQFFRWFSDVYYNNAKLPLDEELEAISCSILRRWLDTSEYVDSTKVISMM